MDLWEANYSITEETAIYQDPSVRTRLNELGWEVQ